MTTRGLKVWHGKTEGRGMCHLPVCCIVILIITMATLHYRWLVKSCTVGKLLPTDDWFFISFHDNGTSDKPEFDVQVYLMH